MQLSNKHLTLSVILVFIIFITGGFFVRHWHEAARNINTQLIAATVLPAPRALSPFKLLDTHHQPFTKQRLQAHWTLLFFGFTACGNICPTTMNVLKQVYANLQAEKSTVPQVVFVSIDPERDTAQRIQQYVSAFNPDFQGATGSKEQLAQLTKELSVLYMQVKQPGNASEYQIDHSGTILLLNPNGDLQAVFSMPHDAESITKDLMVIFKQ
jgi:protein SCO1/2